MHNGEGVRGCMETTLEVAMVIAEWHIVMHKTTCICRENTMSLFVYDDLVFLLDSNGKETKCPVWFTAESDLITSTVPSSCALPALNKNVQSLKWRSHPLLPGVRRRPGVQNIEGRGQEMLQLKCPFDVITGRDLHHCWSFLAFA